MCDFIRTLTPLCNQEREVIGAKGAFASGTPIPHFGLHNKNKVPSPIYSQSFLVYPLKRLKVPSWILNAWFFPTQVWNSSSSSHMLYFVYFSAHVSWELLLLYLHTIVWQKASSTEIPTFYKYSNCSTTLIQGLVLKRGKESRLSIV